MYDKVQQRPLQDEREDTPPATDSAGKPARPKLSDYHGAAKAVLVLACTIYRVNTIVRNAFPSLEEREIRARESFDGAIKSLRDKKLLLPDDAVQYTTAKERLVSCVSIDATLCY